MSGTPRRRAPRGAGENLRAPIVAAAKQLLTEKSSADGVSIRAVADLVGVTPPSIYLHFADKDALLEAVVADVFTQLDSLMATAATGDTPLERLYQQGLAYVRFALQSPEHYRLATMSMGGEFGLVDSALTSAAFDHLKDTVGACMAVGVFEPGDPAPIALDLWAAAHGVASLLIAKPYMPFGEPEEFVYRVLGAAAFGRSVADYLEEPSTQEFTDWRIQLPPRG